MGPRRGHRVKRNHWKYKKKEGKGHNEESRTEWIERSWIIRIERGKDKDRGEYQTKRGLLNYREGSNSRNKEKGAGAWEAFEGREGLVMMRGGSLDVWAEKKGWAKRG